MTIAQSRDLLNQEIIDRLQTENTHLKSWSWVREISVILVIFSISKGRHLWFLGGEVLNHKFPMSVSFLLRFGTEKWQNLVSQGPTLWPYPRRWDGESVSIFQELLENLRVPLHSHDARHEFFFSPSNTWPYLAAYPPPKKLRRLRPRSLNNDLFFILLMAEIPFPTTWDGAETL